MQPRDPVSTAFIYGLGAAVTLAWLVSVFADILVDSYSTPIALHGLMGTVVGSVFADAGLRRARRSITQDDPVAPPRLASHDDKDIGAR